MGEGLCLDLELGQFLSGPQELSLQLEGLLPPILLQLAELEGQSLRVLPDTHPLWLLADDGYCLGSGESWELCVCAAKSPTNATFMIFMWWGRNLGVEL